MGSGGGGGGKVTQAARVAVALESGRQKKWTVKVNYNTARCTWSFFTTTTRTHIKKVWNNRDIWTFLPECPTVQQTVQWHNTPITSPIKCSMTQQSSKAFNDTTFLQPVQQSVQWPNNPTKRSMTQRSYNQSNKAFNDPTIQQSIQWHNIPTTCPTKHSMT